MYFCKRCNRLGRIQNVEQSYAGEQAERFTRLVYVGDSLEDLTNDIISFYVDRDEEPSSEFYINRYTEFVSNLLFDMAVIDGIKSRSEAGWSVYAYLFDYYNDALWTGVPKKLRGAPHASEYPYIHEINTVRPFLINDEDLRVADYFQESFAKFVLTGVPSHHNKMWLDTGTDSSIRYTRIDLRSRTKLGFFNESAAFWQRMRSYYDYDMVQLLPRKNDEKFTHWIYSSAKHAWLTCQRFWSDIYNDFVQKFRNI